MNTEQRLELILSINQTLPQEIKEFYTHIRSKYGVTVGSQTDLELLRGVLQVHSRILDKKLEFISGEMEDLQNQVDNLAFD